MKKFYFYNFEREKLKELGYFNTDSLAIKTFMNKYKTKLSRILSFKPSIDFKLVCDNNSKIDTKLVKNIKNQLKDNNLSSLLDNIDEMRMLYIFAYYNSKKLNCLEGIELKTCKINDKYEVFIDEKRIQ